MMINTLPQGVAETTRLIEQVDRALLTGFVGGRGGDALAALARVFAGTPMDARLNEAAGALERSEFQERHFATLAAARMALQGALYDTLRGQARAWLGRASDQAAPAAQTLTGGDDPLLSSARHWLMELAITGLGRLEVGMVIPFFETLAQMRTTPPLVGVSALLGGFAHELLRALPLTSLEDAPLSRWGDLWSAGMIGAMGVSDAAQTVSVSGTLHVLGIDLRQHAHMVSVVFYALLDGRDLVRITRSSYKVEAIRGDELWLLFPDTALLLDGLASGKAVEVRDMLALPSGDLLWNANAASAGKKYKLFDAAKAFAPGENSPTLGALPPLQRHPVQISEPVFFSDYVLENGALRFGDGTLLPLDWTRSTVTEITPEALEGTGRLFGLLRYDACVWSVQPLTLGDAAGKLKVFVGEGGAKLLKKPPKSSAVATLQERASRLLRK